MTLLASWIGVDTHGPTSAYIVSDSRISWEKNKNKLDHFDQAKKVFASKKYPEIFGYAGDALFPSIVLAQIVEMIDTDILFDEKMTCDEKNQIVYERLRYAFSTYPNASLGGNRIQILHLSRDTIVDGYPAFYHCLMEYDGQKTWKRYVKPIPNQSGLLQALGSGYQEFMTNYNKRYQNGANRSTSRNVFHCFIDTLNNIKDQHCGGLPQLVGIYRKPFTTGKNYGIIIGKQRCFLGTAVPVDASCDKIEWRNELFERCEGNSRKVLDDAVRQLDPLRRKSATP